VKFHSIGECDIMRLQRQPKLYVESLSKADYPLAIRSLSCWELMKVAKHQQKTAIQKDRNLNSGDEDFRQLIVYPVMTR
jgi:hypothetical protein